MMIHWELIASGVDAALIYLFYRLYKKESKQADVIQALPVLEPGPDLQSKLDVAKEGNLPYASVQGITRAVGQALRSRFVNEEGVVRSHTFVEHKSKRSQGYWSDVKRVIKDETNTVPFVIGDLPPSKYDVHVQEPLSADNLSESLSATYDNYEPTKDGAVSRGIDRIFGEVVKGHEETEKMLGIGVRLLGVGKISIAGGKIVISPPDSGEGPYILTTLSKAELVKSFSSRAKVFKVLAWIFGIVGGCLVSYWLYRNVRRHLDDYRMQRMISQMREARARQAEQQQADAGNNNGDENENRDPCVVCLTNPRELVVLECGHLCLCGDCARNLPTPRRCPMCRAHIARLLPVYNS